MRSAGAANSAVMVRVRVSRSCLTSVTGIVQSSWSGWVTMSNAISSSMRAMRPRQTCSSSVSIDATDRTAVTSPLANCSRPLRRLVSRPAFSRTATCFCTAAKLMSYFAARAETECSPASTLRRMSRRVRSASAWNRASARSSSLSLTGQIYNQSVVRCQEVSTGISGNPLRGAQGVVEDDPPGSVGAATRHHGGLAVHLAAVPVVVGDHQLPPGVYQRQPVGLELLADHDRHAGLEREHRRRGRPDGVPAVHGLPVGRDDEGGVLLVGGGVGVEVTAVERVLDDGLQRLRRPGRALGAISSRHEGSSPGHRHGLLMVRWPPGRLHPRFLGRCVCRSQAYGRSVVAAISDRENTRGDIVRLVHRGLGVHEFTEAVTRILRRSVPFDGACLLTIDPATYLPTGEFVENGLSAAATVRLTEIELREPDFNKFTALAREHRPAASLSEATEGDLDQSRRQRELRRPGGFEDELRAVLSGATGTWAALTLLREARRPHFTPAEVSFVATLVEPP